MTSSVSLSEVSPRLMATDVLDEDVSRLSYVSGSREEALRKLGIETVGDLLLSIPRRYLDFSHSYTIETVPIGTVATVVGTVDRVTTKLPRPRLAVTEVCLVDATGVMKVAFFRMPWLAQQIRRGDRLAVLGKVEFSYGFKQMTSPHFEKLDAGSLAQILPVHPATEKVSQAWMRRIVSGALARVVQLPDPVPAALRARRGLMSLGRALRQIHFPRYMGETDFARRRLAYDELLYLQLALKLRDDADLVAVTPYAHTIGPCVERMREALPYALSEEQECAVRDILTDMADASHVMNRLLMGDVGTGKTSVAAFGLAACADTGTQAAMMAPTGVLARQYAGSVGPLLDRCGISWAVLTGSTDTAERARIHDGLLDGTISVLFGTHALLEDQVVFRRLSLVVIDEQHRFGVHQRGALRAKGPGADLLAMSATPIPRTLALSVYGDLDTSIIRHRPVAGAGVTTRVLDQTNRDIALGALRAALEEGRQAYVVCPLVEDGDDADEVLDVVPGLDLDEAGRVSSAPRLRSVAATVEELSRLFPDVCVAGLHGRMRPKEKDERLEAFRAGAIKVLVSTTVVEVGVDVPNATVMLIENGERFGLATLHQLRGRVGRGKLSGLCFVLSGLRSGSKSSSALERLKTLESVSDGFALAEKDLELRHEGEILGYRQHGGITLRFVDLARDAVLISQAHEDATEILTYSPHLTADAVAPMRYEVVRRYGDIFKEVSGG